VTRALRCASLAGVALLTAACVTPPPPPDYTAYVAHMPRSILVLPPVNESIEVQAGEALLSCLTVPLAEMGYYVFPVAAVEDTLRQNGVPEPVDMHQVPPEKLKSVFGCDAVLYVEVKTWGTEYQVLNSSTTVATNLRLVDAATGAVLWSGSGAAVENSSSGESNPVAMLVGALVHQVVNTSTDRAHRLASDRSYGWFGDPKYGMLPGPRRPGWETDPRRTAAATTR